MNSTITAASVFACLFAAIWTGMRLRRRIHERHLNAETKDTVKLAMSLVVTMAALILGLLVNSAKGSYDTTRGEVIQMAAKISFLDRVLVNYGPEAAEARSQVHAAVEEMVNRMWPGEGNGPAQLAPNTRTGDAVFAAIQGLAPRNDTQRDAKAQSASLAVELAQIRLLLLAQAVSSISKPLLIMVVFWLVVIFLSFSLISPPNVISTVALVASALSVSGAIFLILELDRPFGGLIQISSEPMLNVLNQLAK